MGGIIPARAGFTTARFPASKRAPDHPRSRGVYHRGGPLGRWLVGSSPLARGLLNRLLHGAEYVGIIPARAGFTDAAWADSLRSSDHPRSRGVYSGPPDGGVDRCGSSPLARGLPGPRGAPAGGPGIIPARAGFTAPDRTITSRPPDHPRSRGVYSSRPKRMTTHSGSSPLARGLLSSSGRRNVMKRIIPARAGFTSPGPARSCPARDHPRSRGVYAKASWTPSSVQGSSPLARGLRCVGPP